MTAYYNEIDPFAAQWLRNLMQKGLIPEGTVDERSIEDVKPSELRSYTQCHFFAGIGGWAIALQLAGWPNDRPVWTGSCPCQPFSVAGQGKGTTDTRHLWPAWEWHIRFNRPATIFGEQVDAAVRYGWLDDVCSALEQQKYTVAAAILPACSVGAPHLRKRLWFVADSLRFGRGGGGQGSVEGEVPGCEMPKTETTRSSDPRLWERSEWLQCRDGKQRPIEPSTFPLAHGISQRVGRLRAYGNAIVPQVAATFIRSYMEYKNEVQS